MKNLIFNNIERILNNFEYFVKMFDNKLQMPIINIVDNERRSTN